MAQKMQKKNTERVKKAKQRCNATAIAQLLSNTCCQYMHIGKTRWTLENLQKVLLSQIITIRIRAKMCKLCAFGSQKCNICERFTFHPPEQCLNLNRSQKISHELMNEAFEFLLKTGDQAGKGLPTHQVHFETAKNQLLTKGKGTPRNENAIAGT